MVAKTVHLSNCFNIYIHVCVCDIVGGTGMIRQTPQKHFTGGAVVLILHIFIVVKIINIGK